MIHVKTTSFPISHHEMLVLIFILSYAQGTYNHVSIVSHCSLGAFAMVHLINDRSLVRVFQLASCSLRSPFSILLLCGSLMVPTKGASQRVPSDGLSVVRTAHTLWSLNGPPLDNFLTLWPSLSLSLSIAFSTVPQRSVNGLSTVFLCQRLSRWQFQRSKPERSFDGISVAQDALDGLLSNVGPQKVVSQWSRLNGLWNNSSLHLSLDDLVLGRP